MSGDTLTGESLLAAAEAAQAALDAGAPSAGSSEARFIAAMIARTREMATRDRAMVPAIAAQELVVVSQFGKDSDLNTVTAAIRNGVFDGDSSLHQVLYRLAVLRLRAMKPEALAPADRI